jgi:transcriptional regulator with XRE-family HTH domain
MAKKLKTKGRVTSAVDKHIGERVRLARITAKISQADLGGKLGVSFQQIQKYEKGTNRVSAARIEQITHILGVPMSFFYEGMPTNGGPPKNGPPAIIQQILLDRDVLKLAKIMLGVKDRAQRSAILELARTVAKVA